MKTPSLVKMKMLSLIRTRMPSLTKTRMPSLSKMKMAYHLRLPSPVVAGKPWSNTPKRLGGKATLNL